MNIISAQKFYNVWLEIVKNRETDLFDNWYNSSKYTSIILKSKNSVIETVAKKLNIDFYYEYYNLDAVFYNKEEDKVTGVDENYTLLHDIHIAFEHENNFNIKLQEEIAHLLLTNCHLKVLVTYPNGEIDSMLKHFCDIIIQNRNKIEISERENFLIIFGYRKENKICWEGRIFKNDEFKSIGLLCSN